MIPRSPRSCRSLFVLVIALLFLQAAAHGQSFALGTASLTEGPASGTASVLLRVSPSPSDWTASANDSWLHLAKASESGKGSSNVVFTFDANTGATRAGSLTIAGQTLAITQAGAAYVPTPIEDFITNRPSAGVAVDGAGNVYFCDLNAQTIRVYIPATQTVSTLVSTGLSDPAGIAVDGSGNVYIADAVENAVKLCAAGTHALTLVASGLNGPKAVAVDGVGNVYIADTGNNAIKAYVAATQNVTTLISTGLNSPSGVAVDSSGNVYIADTGNNAIKEYVAATQNVTTLVSTGLNSPSGLAVDGSGNVYIADTNNDAAKEYAAATQMVTTVASTGSSAPNSIAVDGEGNLYITSQSGSSFTMFEFVAATQTLTALISNPFGNVTGIATDGVGNLYAADSVRNVIFKYVPATGKTTTLVSTGLNLSDGSDLYLGLSGIAVDRAGNVYFSDVGNKAVKEYVAATGNVTTLVSSGLTSPLGVAVDGSGNVYIADSTEIKEYEAATMNVSTLVSSVAPTGVAVDLLGNVYFSDTERAIKEYIPPTKKTITLIEASSTQAYASAFGNVAVDGAGNVYYLTVDKKTGYNSTLREYVSATKASISRDLKYINSNFTSDENGNIYYGLTATISEQANVFVNGAPIIETNTAGSDSVATVLPASTLLPGAVAPTSSQAWLTVGAISNGLLGFSFSSNSSSGRVGFINELGVSILVIQGTQPPPTAKDVVVYAGNSPSYVDLGSNVASPENYTLSLTAVGTPMYGKASISGKGPIINGEIYPAYTPGPAFEKTTADDSFTYTVSDGHGGSATGTITVRHFASIAGGYDGFLSPSDSDTGDPGYVTVSVTATGSFSGTIKTDGSSASFRGTLAGLQIPAYGPVCYSSFTIPGYVSRGDIALHLNPPNGTPNVEVIGFTTSVLNDLLDLQGTLTPSAAYSSAHPAPEAGTYTVMLPAPTVPTGGTTATATATVGTLSEFAGTITHITVTSGGSGYVVAPTVVITGTGGSGATATAIISGGVVTGIDVPYIDGFGYPSNTTVTIAPPPGGLLPEGTGWATMTVSASGAVTGAGKLGDGTPFSFGSLLHQGAKDTFNLFAPLYGGVSKPNAPGQIEGTVTFEAQTDSDFDGSLTWIKPAQTKGALYKPGFNTPVIFQAGRYAAPKSGQVLTFSNTAAGKGTIEISGGGLGLTLIQNTISVSKTNVVTVTGITVTDGGVIQPGFIDDLSLHITPSQGVFTGSVLGIVPGPRVTPISGVIYQKTQVGAGLFLGGSQTGSVTLTPQ